MEKLRPIEVIAEELERAEKRLAKTKSKDENYPLFQRVVYNRSHEYGSYVFEKNGCWFPMMTTVPAWKLMEAGTHVPVVVSLDKKTGYGVKLMPVVSTEDIISKRRSFSVKKLVRVRTEL